MAEEAIKHLLREWFGEILRAAPEEDRRRTSECLSFAEVVAAGEEGMRSKRSPIETLSAEKARHVTVCSWCQSALQAAERLSRVRQKPGPPTKAEWAAVVRQGLSEWLSRNGEANGATSGAHFDEKGTFHLNLTGLPKDGPTQVSLLWEGVRVCLARGVVSGGRLQIREQLPRLGLRNTRLPAHLIIIEPLTGD